MEHHIFFNNIVKKNSGIKILLYLISAASLVISKRVIPLYFGYEN